MADSILGRLAQNMLGEPVPLADAIRVLRGVAIDFMVGVAPPTRINALDILFYCILFGLRYTIK